MKPAQMMRVTKRNPCPICNKPKYCGVSAEGEIAICMSIADGSVKESANGGYVHILQPKPYTPLAKTKATATVHSFSTTLQLAPIERRHAVFTALLDRLPLSELHADNLLARGLCDTEIARKLYATVPAQPFANALGAELAREFDLAGVPGFYQDKRQWQINLSDWYAGFFVPYRNPQQQIQALQIRRDGAGLRYIWFSSKDKPSGVSSGAPLHCARSWRVNSTHEAIITEGALKADIIANRLDETIIAAAGVDLFPADLGEWLRRELPELQSITIAFDSDWKSKKEVEKALLKLIEKLEAANIEWDVLEWENAKGLDDFLLQEAA